MFKSVDIWLPGYLRSVLHRPRHWMKPAHLMFCIADHFEPFAGGVDSSIARERLNYWQDNYLRVFGRFRDHDGIMPRHTFFYPQEQYDDFCVDKLSKLCRAGCGEVEIHLHHRNDTPQGLKEKLESFKTLLHEKHGLLGLDNEKRIRYGFVHGNTALCNSNPDGDWCGVNEELKILADTGCYADFTFPSAPAPTQPRTVNCIYRATDRNGKPRSHDYGVQVFAGSSNRNDGIMLIPGPLCLDWRRRKYGIFPRIENAELHALNPPVLHRLNLWVKTHICVVGKPEWVFVKIHTHGCVESNMRMLLGDAMVKLHEYLQKQYNDSKEWVLHYVTARELYNIIRAGEDKKEGNPGAYRNYEIKTSISL